MTRTRHRLRPWKTAAPLLAAGLLLTASWGASAAPAKGTPKAPAARGPRSDDCLGCHGDKGAARADGRPVFVLPEVFAASIHGQAGLGCTDCHQDLATAEFPHGDKL